MAGRYPRRIYVVDRRFQLKYTGLLILFGGAIMAAFGWAVWREVLINSELLEGKHIEQGLLAGQPAAGAPAMAEFHQALASADHRMLAIILLTSLAVAATLGLLGILITHRVAGPVLVLSRYAEALSQGTYPPMRPLRKNDELKEYFEVFRHAVDRLKSREAAEIAELEALLPTLSGEGVERLRSMLSRKQAVLEAKLASETKPAEAAP
jgi:HAMP domain-containing protein